MKMLWCTSICLRYFTDGLGNSMNIHQMAIVRSLSGVHAKYGTINDEDSLPIIQYPMQMKLSQMRREKRIKSKRKNDLVRLARPGKVLISGDDPKSVMYTNEYATKFSPPTITSTTWTSHKSPGRHLTIHATRENPAFNTDVKKFQELGVEPSIIESLRRLGMQGPTVIQAKAIPHILSGDNVMFAAETGSGKTLAYLLPIVQSLLSEKAKENKELPAATFPKTIVLTPTQELTEQVVNMGESLKLPIKFLALNGTSVLKKKKVLSEADVVVATPVPLILALKQRKLDLSGIKFAVIDECDTMFDDSFAPPTIHILNRFNIHRGKRLPILTAHAAQIILCSATFPTYAASKLEEVLSMDNMTILRSGHLHRVTTHVNHKFVRVKPSEKIPTLLKLLEESRMHSTIIFCNQHQTVQKVYNACVEHGLLVAKVDSADFVEGRRKTIAEFLSGQGPVLVSTDVASRGLDTQVVGHVINYDVPNHVSDYLHRCGRVGRVGQKHGGVVTNMVSRKWEVKTVMQIEEAAKRRTEIEQVSANIKQSHERRWQEQTVELV